MDGNVRRLPPWMIAGGSSGVTATSNPADDQSVDVNSNHEADDAPITKREKRPRKTIKPKERDDSDEPKKVGIKRKGRERARIKIDEEGSKPSIGDVKNPEIIQSVTGPKDYNLTVDDLLIFAEEHVKGGEDQTRTERESSSIDKSMLVVDESSNTRLSQGETEEPNGTRDSTADDMLSLLLGPFFKSKN
ncbi:unnamed protein product [Microthlaspi erraticum]|uniref:Uncharacterized protein n=1 Tax=Microthlaspi erraticum TaxID=1685480 RepID=A0A6D2KQK4_9BRAS|nr:unnamed protein product [Microthlaspi erraticum]